MADHAGDRPASNPQPSPEPRHFRGWLITFIKVALAAVMVWWVLTYKVTGEQVEKLKQLFLSPAYLAGAVAAFSGQLVIGAFRAQMLLAAQGVNLSYFSMVRLTYLGAFFDAFMVTSVGGDAVKAIYLARESPKDKRVEAVSVLLLDRLLGLLGLIFLMMLMTLFEWKNLSADPKIAPWLKYLLLIPMLALCGTAALLSETVRSSSMMQGLLRILPFSSTLDRAYSSLQGFRDKPVVLLKCWLVSLLAHSLGVLAGYLLLQGLDLGSAAFGQFFVAWFVSNFISSFLPLSGIGLGQAFYEEIFFNVAGVKGAWTLATAVQAAFIVAKAPGVIAFLMTREQPPVLVSANEGKRSDGDD